MGVKTYTAKRKEGYLGPPLRSVSIGELDYDFKPGMNEYTGIPREIAEHLKAHHKQEFQVAEARNPRRQSPRRRKK